MTSLDRSGRSLWRRPMGPRDPAEVHRQASFLELFFDLCFVVAVAFAAAELHHALLENHAASGIASYLAVFFAIWWAWMNFTWFASAYDNDDPPFPFATLVQIAGTLILAAGVPRAFASHDFDMIFLGYAVMRVGLIALWLRAAASDRQRSATALRYAVGLSVAMAGWSVMLVSGRWPLWGWWLMAAVELAVPLWAENAGRTPWHPHHIAERYGLFTIIVLGESVLAATNAVRIAIGGEGASGSADASLIGVIAGGLLIMFSMWWLYFSRPAHPFLTSNRVAFVWGYGHYFILSAAAAAGAGLAVNVDHVSGHGRIGDAVAAASLTVPVAVFLLTLWLLQLRPRGSWGIRALRVPAGAVVVLLTSFTPWPVLLAGFVTAVMVVDSVGRSARE